MKYDVSDIHLGTVIIKMLLSCARLYSPFNRIFACCIFLEDFLNKKHCSDIQKSRPKTHVVTVLKVKRMLLKEWDKFLSRVTISKLSSRENLYVILTRNLRQINLYDSRICFVNYVRLIHSYFYNSRTRKISTLHVILQRDTRRRKDIKVMLLSHWWQKRDNAQTIFKGRDGLWKWSGTNRT